MTNASPSRSELYKTITDRIVAALDVGVRPWLRPWSTAPTESSLQRPMRANGTPYTGINVVLLWSEAAAKGYASRLWMTRTKAQSLHARIADSAQGATVVFGRRFTRSTPGPKGELVEASAGFLKAFTVYNADLIDGLPERCLRLAEPARPAGQPIDRAESLFAAAGADIRHGGSRAFYAPDLDFIQLPPFDAFRSAESYAATKAHELAHWTGHRDRLDRKFHDGKRFGSDGYAFEELVAELSAAFLCADLGIESEMRTDHEAYLGHWVSVLRNDTRNIFTAASHAQRAADFLLATAGRGAACDTIQAVCPLPAVAA